MESIYEKQSQLKDEVGGKPMLKLDSMGGTSVPSDFDFDRVLGDIVMAEIIDENEFGEIMRNGVWVSQDITKKLWRKAKVYLVGPDCKGVNVGDIVVYPSDKGIPMVKTPKKYIFLNKERIFGVLKPETISV